MNAVSRVRRSIRDQRSKRGRIADSPIRAGAADRVTDRARDQIGEPVSEDAMSNVSRPRHGNPAWLILSLQVSVGVIGLTTWEILSRTGILDPFFFSSPTAVFARVVELCSTPSLYGHLLITIQEALLGLFIGVVLGVSAGLLLARIEILAQVFLPYIYAINAVPRLLLAPIFLIWLGLGMGSKIALVISLVFFVIFFNVYIGVKEVDKAVLNNARMLGASELQLLHRVIGPSALVWIFSSLRTSVGFAIMGAVAGEYLGSAAGIGYLIAQYKGLFDTTGVFAGMSILVVFAVCIDYLANRAEKRLLRWKPTAT
jgi:NitT/TauT family transport system permease protein